MNEMLLVTITNRLGDLSCPSPCQTLLERSMFRQVIKKLSVRAQFHDHEDFVVRDDDFIELRHIWMNQVAPGLDFANQGRMVNPVNNLDGNGETC